jgi:hypothetical protein
MSDNIIHKINFEDLETFHTVLHMPRPNNCTSDIEHQFIMQEEVRQGVASIRNIFSSIYYRLQKDHQQTAGKRNPPIRRVALKSHIPVRH